MKNILYILLLMNLTFVLSCDSLIHDGAARVKESLTMPTEGLVLYYPFNGSANNEVADNYHGVPTDANGSNGDSNTPPQLTTDRHGTTDSAYIFDGTDDYIQVINPAGGNLYGNEGTVSIWINHAVFSDNGFVFTDWTADSRSIYLEVRDDNTFDGVRGNSTNTGNFRVTSVSTISTNTWYHVCYTWKVGDTCKIYINGTLNAEDDVVQDSAWLTTGSSDGLQFGGSLYNGTFDTVGPFQGKLDDIRLYSRVLSEKEIEKLSNEGG